MSAGGKVLTFADAPQYPDWYWVNVGTFSGWINKLRGYPTPLKIAQVTPPTNPVPTPGVSLTDTELESLAEYFSTIGKTFEAVSGIFRQAALRG